MKGVIFRLVSSEFDGRLSQCQILATQALMLRLLHYTDSLVVTLVNTVHETCINDSTLPRARLSTQFDHPYGR